MVHHKILKEQLINNYYGGGHPSPFNKQSINTKNKDYEKASFKPTREFN